MHDLKKDFLDAPELAHLLNRSLATIHLYRKAGKIPQPTARLNTVYLWDRKDIEQWCGKNTLPPDIEPCNDPCFYCGGVK